MTTEHNERLIELRVTLDKFISLCKKALFSDLRYTTYVTGVWNHYGYANFYKCDEG